MILSENILNKLHSTESHSPCVKRKVGCVIFNNDEVLSSSYNHSIIDENSCNNIKIEDHSFFASVFEIHAEISAINELLKRNIDLSKYTNLSILISFSPCNSCLKSIIDVGIKNIYYIDEYSKDSQLFNYVKDVKYKNLRVLKIDIRKK